MIRIAIHHEERSFSTRWIEYCSEQGISYEVVNCFNSDIIKQLRMFDALLWNWKHYRSANILVAKNVIFAAEAMGLIVYPDMKTCWHFDDKIAQKYLLEAVNAPTVLTSVFYELTEALKWINTAHFPKVFKLRKGAGSVNVRLIRNRREAKKLARKAFKSGFKPTRKLFYDANKKIHEIRRREGLIATLRKILNTVKAINRINKELGNERGYFYVQDFIPDNSYDTRIVVIGKRAFGFTRDVRKNDFRASGSGSIDYSLDRINPQCVQTAFDVAGKIGAQTLTFDFLQCPNGRARIAEVSYCFPADTHAVYNCPGYWDDNLIWHEGHIHPEDAILTDLIEKIEAKDKT